jgi:hypothetical protein
MSTQGDYDDDDDDGEQREEPLLIPPLNFAMVNSGIYRSGYPNKKVTNCVILFHMNIIVKLRTHCSHYLFALIVYTQNANTRKHVNTRTRSTHNTRITYNTQHTRTIRRCNKHNKHTSNYFTKYLSFLIQNHPFLKKLGLKSILYLCP